ncbi:MAG: hypothetical protein CMM91_00695 [Rickettsiales bacterium]|nr:hypothetical protein [Rickettsiales bacterium]OUV54922.1 MAG: hypothetical protein CBC87_00200 [Rickettsiales bacterium TMED127]|tara:strand:- start:10974 stop:11840 length:867 start_codon:yes stop_codon:yes gene_type:complete
MKNEKFDKTYFQILSSFLFALLGVQIKILTQHLNLESLVFYRCFFGTLIIFFVILIQLKKIKINGFIANNQILQLLRAVVGVGAMYMGYKALTIIPLAMASTISFTKVFFVTFLSFFFLKEDFKLKILFLAAIGLLGVYLIINPTTTEGSNKIGIYLSIISAFFVGIGIVLTSFLTKKNRTITILFYHSFFSLIFSSVIFFNKIEHISWDQFLLILIFTFTALLGQYFNTESYKNKKASVTVLFSYTRIIFSFLFGYFIFNETLSGLTLLGLALIVISTLSVKKFTKL